MNIYLLRHGIAVERGSEGFTDATDDQRPLTQEGVRKMREAANGMVRLQLEVDEILSSPLPRAWETSQIVARAFRWEDRLVECPELAPGIPCRQVFSLLQRKTAKNGLMLVGHEPGLSQLAMQMLGGTDSGHLEFKKGGIALFELEFVQVHPQAQLVWWLPPKILRALAK